MDGKTLGMQAKLTAFRDISADASIEHNYVSNEKNIHEVLGINPNFYKNSVVREYKNAVKSSGKKPERKDAFSVSQSSQYHEAMSKSKSTRDFIDVDLWRSEFLRSFNSCYALESCRPRLRSLFNTWVDYFESKADDSLRNHDYYFNGEYIASPKLRECYRKNYIDLDSFLSDFYSALCYCDTYCEYFGPVFDMVSGESRFIVNGDGYKNIPLPEFSLDSSNSLRPSVFNSDKSRCKLLVLQVFQDRLFITSQALKSIINKQLGISIVSDFYSFDTLNSPGFVRDITGKVCSKLISSVDVVIDPSKLAVSSREAFVSLLNGIYDNMKQNIVQKDSAARDKLSEFEDISYPRKKGLSI